MRKFIHIYMCRASLFCVQANIYAICCISIKSVAIDSASARVFYVFLRKSHFPKGKKILSNCVSGIDGYKRKDDERYLWQKLYLKYEKSRVYFLVQKSK